MDSNLDTCGQSSKSTSGAPLCGQSKSVWAYSRCSIDELIDFYYILYATSGHCIQNRMQMGY
jgi:hypothetical protein